ncbi:MAG: MBL fold metallo-hydrolase [Acidobacteria bacterium]|nr:MBL fold metallo-hydrolase [Acidobacteriota bacterium]
MSRAFFVCLCALFCAPVPLPAQEAAQEAAAAARVAGPVYMIEGKGAGNIGVIAHPGGAIVIDAGMAASAAGVRATLDALPGGGRIRFLVNTHWHSDHTDGNRALGQGAAIVAHDRVRPLLARPQSLMGQTTAALPDEALPSVTFSERLTLYAGDLPVRLVHYAGAHTNGDTVVYIDRYKAVHMGDLFFNGLFPFLDIDNGGDIESWVRHLDDIVSKLPADARVIPGHGPLASVADLVAFRNMLAESAEIVRQRIQKGATLDQVKNAGLPLHLEPWTHGFMNTAQWLELVYRSLAKN